MSMLKKNIFQLFVSSLRIFVLFSTHPVCFLDVHVLVHGLWQWLMPPTGGFNTVRLSQKKKKKADSIFLINP